jgi:Transposase
VSHGSQDWPCVGIGTRKKPLESNQGAAVDQLLQRDDTVYPVNPVASESYRKRKAPSGTKTDHFDGWGLADALRVDGQGWKTLQPMDPLSQQLRHRSQGAGFKLLLQKSTKTIYRITAQG